MTRQLINTIYLNEDPYFLKQMDDFKYLGININSKKNMHNKIKLRIIVEKCCHKLQVFVQNYNRENVHLLFTTGSNVYM